ncbi:MAG: hypothetical protein IIY82_01960 [Firmicutes bacterium]|nr:hypothetical protein [Bacillota bacterium]
MPSVSSRSSGRDGDAVRKGTVISTFFAIIVAGGCYFLGGFGRLYADQVVLPNGKVNFDGIVPTMISDLPDLIIAIVIVLVLSASMSTLSSLVLTSSSTLTLDVIVPSLTKRGEKSDEKKQVLIMRGFILFFIVISAVIAIVKDAYGFTFIAQMMGISWGALAGAFLAPFLYGLYWKRASKIGVLASFITGVSIEIVQLVISLTGRNFASPVLSYLFTSSVRSGAVAMLVGFLVVPVVSLITKAPDRNRVEEIFANYDNTVIVTRKENLGK